MDKEYLTVKEVAAKLGFTTNWIGKMLQTGQIPGYRFGQSWRIDSKDLEAWIAASSNQKKTG